MHHLSSLAEIIPRTANTGRIFPDGHANVNQPIEATCRPESRAEGHRGHKTEMDTGLRRCDNIG